MKKWKVLNARVSLFPVASPAYASLSADQIYRQIWVEGPDSFQRQTNPLLAAMAQGKQGEIMVQCFAHPSRFDLSLTSAANSPLDSTIPVIEDVAALQSEFERIMKAVSGPGIVASATRVALAIQFLTFHMEVPDANRALMDVIPSRYGVKVKDEEDLIFQINRPYRSENFQELTINAITKWSVERLQVVTFAFPGTSPLVPMPASPIPKREQFIAASVTFDNNNNPSAEPLGPNQQRSLLTQLLGSLVRQQREIGLDVEGLHELTD